MSCSKDSTVKYLIDKKLVKPNMELYTPLPTERLSKTIDSLTKIDKDKYNVDMGKLFNIRFREVSRGNYLTLGSSSIVSKIRLEPNEAAFEAIDRSKAQEDNKLEKELNDKRYDVMGKHNTEFVKIQEEGNYIVNDDGDIVVPSSLPQINVRC